MAVLAFPTLNLKPEQATFYALGNTRVFPSPDARYQQRARLGGALWRARIDYPLLDDSDRRLLDAFLATLDGAWQTFYFGPYLAGLARAGAGGGTPLVNNAGQTGSALATDGWPNNTTVLKAGDYLHFDAGGRRELKIVTADATSNGAGQVTISIKPPIRVSPADGAPLEITQPTCVMALVEDDHGGVAVRAPRFGQVALEFVEALWTS